MVNDRLVQIEAEQLLALQENPKVSKQALERAFELAFPEPDQNQWQSFLLRLFYSLGGALFVCGMFFFVDHFWDDMNYLMRTGFFAISTLVSALAAWRRGRHSIAGKVALSCTSVLLGGLIIVGSEAHLNGNWPLVFSAWSALTVPLAIAAEFAPLWLFATGLLNVTLSSVCQEYCDRWFFQDHYYEIAILVLNVGLLVAWEIGFRQGKRWMGRRWFPPILTLIGLKPITLTACVFIVNEKYADLFFPIGLVLVLTWAAFLSYFSGIRRDVSVLSLTLGSGIFVGTSFLWALVLRSGEYVSLFLLSSGIIIQISAALGLLRKLAPPVPIGTGEEAQESTTIKVWLGKLATEGLIQTRQLEELSKSIQLQQESALPWFVRALAAFGAFFSSVFLLLYLIFTEIVTQDNGVVFGIGLCFFACVAARVKSDLLQQAALSVSLCGQLLVWLVMGANNADVSTIALSMFGLELALVLFYPLAFGRFLAFNIGGLFLSQWLLQELPYPVFDVYVALVACLAAVWWLRQPTIFSGPLGRSHGPIALGSVSLLFLLLFSTLSHSGGWPEVGLLASAALMALVVYCAEYIGAPKNVLIGLGAVGLICANAPGVMAAVLGLLLGFYRRNQTLRGTSIVFLIAFGTAFYYHLAFSLLTKSVILMASGVVLGLTARSLESRRPTSRIPEPPVYIEITDEDDSAH